MTVTMTRPAGLSTMQTAQRIASVDIVRGSVMVFMALDHVRDFVSIDRFPPEDLSRASVALFATRWSRISAPRPSFSWPASASAFC